MVQVETANQLKHLKELLASGGDVSIAVAYVRQSGLRRIEAQMKEASRKGNVRFLFSLDGRTTEPAAAERLLELANDRFKVKYFDIPASEQSIFHSKLFIASSHLCVTFLTGSYNLTGAALERNREHGLKVTCTSIERPGQEALASFNAMWDNDLAKPLTEERLADYAANYRSTVRLPKDELHADRNYWLFKCSVSKYTWEDLERNRLAKWNGVRNYEARNYMRDKMRVGDQILFYHSSANPSQVMGIATVVKAAYSDHTAWDVNSEYFDKRGKSTPGNTPWVMVDIRVGPQFERPVTLEQLEHNVNLQDMEIFKKANQVSVLKMRPEEFAEILRLGRGEQ